METCSTCCDVFNKSNRKKVSCGYCPDFAACTSCTEHYLVDSNLDAHCMSCRKTWPRSFLASTFTQKFMNKTYKERRENLLFERERALLPETQEFVELEIECRRLTRMFALSQDKSFRAYARSQRIEAMATADVAKQFNLREEHEAVLKKLEMRTAARKEYRLAHEDFLQVKELRDIMWRRRYSNAPKARRQFVKACPAPDCKGFLSTAWKCGVCEQWSCPECHELKGPENDTEHTCNPDSVATAKLLAHDSRSCPKCAAMIFKVSGCDQMWCTQCQTAFSWRTGSIETTIIHNPHYYDYMRTHGGLPRQAGDVPCGGLPYWSEVVSKNFPVNLLPNMHRAVTHATQYLTGFYMTHPINNREMRVKYMMNELSEDKFKKEIQRNEKAAERARDIRHVVDLFSAVSTDLGQQLMAGGDPQMFYDSMMGLREYTNTSMLGVSKTFSNCVTPRLSLEYNWDR